MTNLLLITGAGASHDVTNTTQVNSAYIPPLSKHLFNDKLGGVITECLKENHLAWQAGSMFYANKGRNTDEEVNLEQYIARLRDSDSLILKKQYWAIPIYLYELFYKISHKYLPTSFGLPSNYKGLIDAISSSNKYDQLLWLNLNYDLFADKAIKASIKNKEADFKLEDYTQFETEDGKLKIKYTKPHGSVDWCRNIREPGIKLEHIKKGLNNLPKNFIEVLSPEICMRYGMTENQLDAHYPALTAPIGKDYNFVYNKHIKEIIPDLEYTKDVLCIGFNCLDEDILKLLKHIPKIVKLKIINKTLKYGKEAFARISVYHQNIWEPQESAIFNGGFSDFMGKDLQKWLSRNIN